MCYLPVTRSSARLVGLSSPGYSVIRLIDKYKSFDLRAADPVRGLSLNVGVARMVEKLQGGVDVFIQPLITVPEPSQLSLVLGGDPVSHMSINTINLPVRARGRAARLCNNVTGLAQGRNCPAHQQLRLARIEEKM